VKLSVFLVILLTHSYFFGYCQSRKYEYTIDLTTVVNDRVRVELQTPSINDEEITFYMPRIIPGSYAVCDYGRFVKDLQATDRRGNHLPVERIDVNSWKIHNARRLSRVSYWVDDSFDSIDPGPEIFWPAGTNIENEKNFLINTSGFFGYLGAFKNMPFEINVIRKNNFYGSTGLIPAATHKPKKSRTTKPMMDENGVDVFMTSDYEELIDSPIMYSEPDTAHIVMGRTDVVVASYSPNKIISAREISASIEGVLKAQQQFLGGALPVDKYAFIFYFTDQPVMSYGALEHSYSSVYYMPEDKIENMREQLREIAAHEFFHILTPLTIHSEFLEDFDFNNPRMSQHLWMYEGVPEYFASSVQVKHGLISHDQFLKILQEKMHTADQFVKDVPFTDISRYTLDKYHDQFYNVYQKGALIALCLDLKLLKMSSGKYGLRNLMLDLSKKFGKEKAFADDKLFEEITKMTFPHISEFFHRYVSGIEQLPLLELLARVGVTYVEEKKFYDYSLGITNAEIGVTQLESKPRLQISSVAKQNAMGAALGLQEGDILISINDDVLPDLGPELGEVLHKHFKALKENETLTYVVLRKNESGELKEVRLTAPVVKIEIVKRHLLQFDPNATPEQLALRDAWLKP
jgi:predicted metalloprotease with PDZ domain